jgi:glycosyltransferase involved in cell wall biosynthesis
MTAPWPRKTIISKRAAAQVDVTAPTPSVSVIIPTYNRAALLPRAIDSVLRQTFPDFELIVVDDGSTDGSADVARSYTDSRVRVIQLRANSGVARALNEGIVATRSEFVALLGDDDEWLPELLDRLIARLRNDKPLSFVHSAATWMLSPGLDDTGNLIVEPAALPEGELLDNLLAGTAQICASSCLIRRNVLLALGGFDEALRRGEDTDLWLRMSVAGHRFAVVREPLAIVHYDHGLGHLTIDPVLQAISLQRYHRRWGQLARERLGADVYDRRHQRKSQRLRREHRKLLKRLRRDGDRTAAWHYARQMLSSLPWGAPYVAQAIAIAMFGRLPHRLHRVIKKLRRRAADVPP